MTGGRRTRVKICGLREPASIDAAIDAGADALGFVFARKSPRYIAPEEAANLVCDLPPFVDAVALFVDTPVQQMIELADEACIDTIQLHGSEDEGTMEQVSVECARVINAITFSADEVRRWGRNPAIDLLLIDGSAGGMGDVFDWSALAELSDSISLPIMIAGGLTPENVGEAIQTVRPYAVDVSSGVESSRGIKDAGLIRAFCAAVRDAGQSEG